MQLEYMKLILAAGWMSVVCAAGIAGGLNSLQSWTVLSTISLLPTLVMMRQWNHPGQGLAESIREARR